MFFLILLLLFPGSWMIILTLLQPEHETQSRSFKSIYTHIVAYSVLTPPPLITQLQTMKLEVKHIKLSPIMRRCLTVEVSCRPSSCLCCTYMGFFRQYWLIGSCIT